MDLFEKHIEKHFDKAKEKVQGAIKDSLAGKELQAGLDALDALPPFEGSILYTMEFEAIASYLRTLKLVVGDGRMGKMVASDRMGRWIEV